MTRLKMLKISLAGAVLALALPVGGGYLAAGSGQQAASGCNCAQCACQDCNCPGCQCAQCDCQACDCGAGSCKR